MFVKCVVGVCVCVCVCACVCVCVCVCVACVHSVCVCMWGRGGEEIHATNLLVVRLEMYHNG